MKDNCQKRVGWLGKSFWQVAGQGRQARCCYFSEFHELWVSSPSGDASLGGKAHGLEKGLSFSKWHGHHWMLP